MRQPQGTIARRPSILIGNAIKRGDGDDLTQSCDAPGRHHCPSAARVEGAADQDEHALQDRGSGSAHKGCKPADENRSGSAGISARSGWKIQNALLVVTL
jgi:hypothetical protein